MKKVLSIVLSLTLVLALLSGCGASESTASAETAAQTAAAETTEAAAQTEAAQTFTVAIVQQLDHASLDEIRLGVAARLEELAQEKGIEIEVQEYSGQNDASVLNQIGAQVVGDGVDLIITIAAMAATCRGPTSDALNTAFILEMMLAVQPDVETVGLLYSNSEVNSVTPIAEAKAYLEEKGIAYLEKTGTSPDEIIQAANSMVGRVQAVFTPTDNAVMATETAVAEILNNAGIPHYTGADSFVFDCGAFTTCGVNYTELGEKTAEMAVDILLGGEIPEYHVMEGGIITVNTDTAAILGVDYSVFYTMANTVVEVTTAE